MSSRTRRLRTRRAVSRSLNAINACVEMLEDRTLFAFGLTTTTNSFIVDTGANLTFAVKRVTSGNGAVGDLISMKYNGTELSAPFASTSRFSHYESGLGSGTTVTAATIGNAIVVTCSDLAGTGVIQYYIAKSGENNIYMAQYAPGPSSPSPGEMRFITYLNWNVFTNHPNESDTSLNETAIESSDVFQENNAPKWTHSKYYGEHRFMDSPGYWGATGTSGANGFGAFMFAGNRETSSGGPFYKDIDFQSTGAAVELYNYTFSGHSQTENFRPGLKGPFALQFTNGSAPTPVDYSFIDGLPLTGLTPASGRGAVSGIASGAAAGLEVTVGLSNASFQYFGHPDNAGNYTLSGVMPGTYTETLYQGELAIGTKSVTVAAGNTTSSNIASTFAGPTPIWRIGTWDGTPIGFLNADKIQNMHPSDPRMSPWVNTNYIVGTSSDSSFPMSEWKNLNGTVDDTNTITFNLTAQQVQAMQLRIGITTAEANGRPIISVNNGSFSAAPSPSTQPTTRNLTVGNWRGNNFTFTYNIAASALHAGTNNIRIQIASGSSSTSPYLQPSDTFDAIELNPTIPAAPTGLVAQTISDHEIDLVTWNQSPGATSYNVKRSATSGGPYTTIATGVTSTFYQDPTLNSGTKYFYVVSAVNGAGEGNNSAQASAQTLAAAPTNLAATPISAHEIDLVWDAAFGAASYNVKRALVSGGPYATIASGLANPSFHDTTVASGTEYFYVVTAVDSGGESLASAEASATTQPDAPTGLSASPISASEVDLNWAGSNGATSYSIKRSDTSGGPYTTIADNVTATNFADISVDGGTRYYYVVSASDDGGEGEDSAEASALTQPAAPANLVASDVSTSEIDLSWDGSTGATLYTIKRADSSGGPYSVIDTTTFTTYADLTVQGAHRYYYVVSASNSSGEGEDSNEAVATTPPVGVDDNYTIDEDNSLNATDAAGASGGTSDDGVLVNDSAAPGLSLTASLLGGPSHGMLTFNSDGTFSYAPAANYNGDDSFTYIANDGLANSNVVTVNIHINSVNDPPTAGNNSYSTNENTPLSVPVASGVLINDSDVDNDPLHAVLVTGPQHGTLTLNSDGSFLYTPAPTFAGTDTFTYKANDGQADSNVASVQITTHNTIGIILLDQSGKALTISGNGFVDVASGGAVIVDSSNSQAVSISGNGRLDASTIDIVGGDVLTGHATIDGAVFTGQGSVADPLAGVAAPNPNALTVRSTSRLSISGTQIVTLNPGVYIGGIAISGLANVTLNPGIYYMQGGGLSVSGNGKLTDLGQGVLIYNSGTAAADSINFSGNGQISLSPMQTGAWQGITIFQTRTSRTSLVVSGNGQLNVIGAIYAASASLIITGNAGTDAYGNPLDQFGTNLILADLQVSGNGAIVI